MATTNRWQDCRCTKCNQVLTDPKNANTAMDIATGGLKGWHTVCPADKPVHPFIAGWDTCRAQVLAINPEIAAQLVKPAEPPAT